MKSGPVNLRSGDFDLREAARAAARRMGMTLGEWLDDAIAERAARMRIAPEDLDESAQIDAIAARLGALPLDPAAPRRLPRRMEIEPAPVRSRKPNMRLLDAAAERLGLPQEPQHDLRHDTVRQTPPETEDVIEVARRIAELEDALGRRRARQQPDHARPGVDGRLRRIAESLLQEDVEPQAPELRRIEARLDRLIDALEHPAPARKPRPDPLQGEIEALRGQIGDLSRAVAVVGDRATKQNFEPALLDLLSRIETSRAYGVSDEALAPVMSALLEIRDGLAHSPTAVARAMGAEIAGLHDRLDALAPVGDGAAIRALRDQVETLARNLAELVHKLVGQDALQRQISALAERVEEIAAAPRELSDRLAGLIDDLRQCIERLDDSPAFRLLERRIEEIAIQRSEASPDLARMLHELRESIDNLTEHPTMRAMQMQMAQLTQITGELPRHLMDTLDGLRRAIENMAGSPALGAEFRAAPLPGHLTESLSEIRLSLERLAANAGVRLADDQAQRLQTIEERVTEISEKLDAPPIIERIAGLQDALFARLDRLRSDLPHDQIAALRARVEDVHRAVSQPDLPQAPTGRLEELVNQLSTKLERASQTGAQDPRALQAIENQVLRIAERLDRHGETSEAIGTLERSLSELFAQVSETRNTADANIGATIARDLSSLRSMQDETEQRTRATLEAVHETLEKVVDRLAMLESDVGVLRIVPSTGRNQAPRVESARQQTPVTTTAAPLAPAPVVAAAPAAAVEPEEIAAPNAPSRHDLALELSEPRAAQKSFIAAARRATQLMGAAPPPPRVEHDGEIAEARARARAAADAAGSAGTGMLGDTSRKMLLGVAGLVLSMGAYQLMRDDGPLANADMQPPVPQASIAETPDASAPAPVQQAGAEATDPMPVGSLARPGADLVALRELAVAGDAPAQYELATRLAEGRGAPRDAAQAARWLEKAAAQGYTPAEYRLGALYEKGAGVQRSMKDAARWYGRAAQAGHIRAMHNLGVLLADGPDGRPDYHGAADMFRRAAEHGLRDSQYNLAVLYVRGLGVEANLVEAYKFFALAGAQGDADALNRRDEIGERLPAKQVNDARKAADAFALRTPDPIANDPAPIEAIISARVSAPANTGAAPVGAKTDARVTSLK